MQELDKRTASLLSRDMTPYAQILSNVSKYFKAGSDITILEIGVRRGASTKAFLNGFKERLGTGHLYSIDIQDRSYVSKSKDWTFILGDSKAVEWSQPVDVLFIDGDHTYEGVKADFEKYEPLVVDKGLIIMHDVSNRDTGVPIFWKEITYPKANLALNAIGLGIINKICISQ